MRRPNLISEDDLKTMLANRDKVRSGIRAGEPAPSPPFHFTFSITGPMVSGKNQVQLLWRNGKVLKYPNQTFTNWRQRALIELLGQDRPLEPIAHPVSLVCDYWPADLRTRDVTGMADAIFHLLVKAGILRDDGLIHDFAWRRHELNRKFPKVLMAVQELTP